MWIVVAYFPHSNIPVLLPTVRAERFWYFPVIGSSLAIAAGMAWMVERARTRRTSAVVVGLCATFLTFQAACARIHAFAYKDDLTFWNATRKASPNSAKAHLNYSLLCGVHGRPDLRLRSNQRALQLAPTWPVAHIYLGDALCRLDRADEAWPHYKRGFELAPDARNLIALGLQCLWDRNALQAHRDELLALADAHNGKWLAHLARDTLYNADKYRGVDPQYQPRGYNEGPKE
jgi:tetratricopeptide (TPR) repeat protein